MKNNKTPGLDGLPADFLKITHIKPQLNIIISKNQTGLLKGRSISDCTRLIYDLLFKTKKKQQNIPGLLVSIDFEKTFDSTSWEFLYKSMMLIGFDDAIIKWIKLFNNDIQARVQQCGFLSDPIPIEKGCRQGDPIAPYLFLIAGEILNIMIVSNPGLKGIIIGKT